MTVQKFRRMDGLVRGGSRWPTRTAQQLFLPEAKTAWSRGRLGAIVTAAALLFALSLSDVPADAQTNYGSAVGTVTDPTGAVVPDATVRLKNAQTNSVQTMVTGSAGNYSFVNLLPDQYDVTVTKSGFQSVMQSSINVQVGGAARVDVTLRVGS